MSGNRRTMNIWIEPDDREVILQMLCLDVSTSRLFYCGKFANDNIKKSINFSLQDFTTTVKSIDNMPTNVLRIGAFPNSTVLSCIKKTSTIIK